MKKTGKEFLYNKAGITLIALVVSMIVLLILASISISLLRGDNGIIIKSIETKYKQNINKKLQNIKKH